MFTIKWREVWKEKDRKLVVLTNTICLPQLLVGAPALTEPFPKPS